MEFQAMYYEVIRIDGDYAYLLPDAIMEGSRLKYEMLQYEIIE